jgi:type II restriction enzyme
MRRDAAIAAIVDLCSKGAGFGADAAAIAAAIATPNRATLVEALLECGVIPESFGHDSTEEKLYSKYTDVLLERALTAMGLKCVVVVERAGRADVEGEAADYSIVGDAKVFRLSRTAKNQKDFKVAALSGWRGKKTYALLVGPLYQFPPKNSQIYEQAIRQKVTRVRDAIGGLAWV